jgi:hypothetical protein
MKFELDIEFVDKIVIETMKKDYISQQDSIARLLSKTEPLRAFQVEDLWMHREVAQAIEVILRYYMYRLDADAWIEKHKMPCGNYHE